MNINEIPNIEHCYITEIGSPAFMYKIKAKRGWYIHLNNDIEDTVDIYKSIVVLRADCDFSIVQILATADLPENAKKC